MDLINYRYKMRHIDVIEPNYLIDKYTFPLELYEYGLVRIFNENNELTKVFLVCNYPYSSITDDFLFNEVSGDLSRTERFKLYLLYNENTNSFSFNSLWREHFVGNDSSTPIVWEDISTEHENWNFVAVYRNIIRYLFWSDIYDEDRPNEIWIGTTNYNIENLYNQNLTFLKNVLDQYAGYTFHTDYRDRGYDYDYPLKVIKNIFSETIIYPHIQLYQL